MRFGFVELDHLVGFDGHNVLFALGMIQPEPEQNEGIVRVSMPSSYGCETRFRCRTM